MTEISFTAIAALASRGGGCGEGSGLEKIDVSRGFGKRAVAAEVDGG
jgi:hypothetical protein